jgi:hypothetical protein
MTDANPVRASRNEVMAGDRPAALDAYRSITAAHCAAHLTRASALLLIAHP